MMRSAPHFTTDPSFFPYMLLLVLTFISLCRKAPAGRPERSLRALAAARQMATTAALRAVRRAANDAADEAVLGRRRRPSAAEAAWEALLALLPAARHATRAEIRKNESCAICHGKLCRGKERGLLAPLVFVDFAVAF